MIANFSNTLFQIQKKNIPELGPAATLKDITNKQRTNMRPPKN
jgi:hypothetical protein